MKRKEWLEYHGFTEEEGEAIAEMMRVVNGRVVAIVDNKNKEILRCPIE